MENQPIPQKIEDTPEWKKHRHLKGKPISIREASRKYDIPDRTIGRWAIDGIIKVLGKDGNKKLLDESYVAYTYEVRKQRPGQGKWLFDENGLPYTPETTQL